MDTEQLPDAEPVWEGGDPVCWARLVCPECGAVVSEGHQDGCQSAAETQDSFRPG